MIANWRITVPPYDYVPVDLSAIRTGYTGGGTITVHVRRETSAVSRITAGRLSVVQF